MYLPAVHDEITTMIGYLEQQLDAVRAAPYGLTEQQVRERPTRSALSIGGIVKHIAYGLGGWADLVGPGDHSEAAVDFAAYGASFALDDEETMEGVLADFDAARGRYLDGIRSVDPDADAMNPPAPWFGIFSAQPIKQRYLLWHQVEEVARHAGHADIIREQLDGVSVPALVMTREQMPANDFFQPYVPAPGTITA